MRYNSEALEIKAVISGNSLLFKDIKISLGLLTSARKNHALCRENHKLHLSTNTNNRISRCYRNQYSKLIYLIRRSTLQVYLAETVAVDWFSFLLSLQNYHLPEINNYLNDTWVALVQTSAIFFAVSNTPYLLSFSNVQLSLFHRKKNDH